MYLIEIPRSLLLEIGNLTANDFSNRTAGGGSRADVYVSGRKAFTLRLDGSVEKCNNQCSFPALWKAKLIQHVSFAMNLIPKFNEFFT